jgi:hypothetical protein
VNKKRTAVLALAVLLSGLTSGCISIEQEIYLQPDGSGEMVLHVSLPDFPEEMRNAQPGPKGNPEDTVKGMKSDILSSLPPTIKLKETKEVRQNGVQGFYAVLQFKQLKDVEAVLASFGEKSLTEGKAGAKDASQWKLRLAKRGAQTVYSQLFFADITATAGAKATVSAGDDKQKKETEAAAEQSLDDQIMPLVLSLVKVRFVLHAPAPITETNADIVLNGKTAIWNGSFAAFAKDKKPIEMKATF